MRETQDQLREAEAGAQATAAGIERRDAAARELETRLADRDEELRLARDRADAARCGPPPPRYAAQFCRLQAAV